MKFCEISLTYFLRQNNLYLVIFRLLTASPDDQLKRNSYENQSFKTAMTGPNMSNQQTKQASQNWIPPPGKHPPQVPPKPNSR